VNSIQKGALFFGGLWLLGWAVVIFLCSGGAHADMCGPSNLPVLSYLNPHFKGCQAFVPGAGNLPQIPVVGIPGTAPAPVYIPPWGSWLRP
jgi:hypothetical protein